MVGNEDARPTGNEKLSGMAILTVLSGIVASFAALPQAFEQYPKGAATVSVLILVGLFCWVYVTRLKCRRS
jgi:hypothetical protein